MAKRQRNRDRSKTDDEKKRPAEEARAQEESPPQPAEVKATRPTRQQVYDGLGVPMSDEDYYDWYERIYENEPQYDEEDQLDQETDQDLQNSVVIDGPPQIQLQPDQDALPSPHGQISTGDHERHRSNPIVAPRRDPDSRDRNDLGGDESPAAEIEDEQTQPADSLSPITQVDRGGQDFTPHPGSGNEPGELSDPEEQKKMIRYLAEERPWMREQLQKDQERDAKQFNENAMRQEAEEIERERAKPALHPDDAGAILNEPSPDNTRTHDNEKPRDKSSSPAHEDDAGAVLDEPAPTPSRNRDKDMDID